MAYQAIEECRETKGILQYLRLGAVGALLPLQGRRDLEGVIARAWGESKQERRARWQHLRSWLEGGNRGIKCLTSCFSLISYWSPLPKYNLKPEKMVTREPVNVVHTGQPSRSRAGRMVNGEYETYPKGIQQCTMKNRDTY